MNIESNLSLTKSWDCNWNEFASQTCAKIQHRLSKSVVVKTEHKVTPMAPNKKKKSFNSINHKRPIYVSQPLSGLGWGLHSLINTCHAVNIFHSLLKRNLRWDCAQGAGTARGPERERHSERTEPGTLPAAHTDAEHPLLSMTKEMLSLD